MSNFQTILTAIFLSFFVFAVLVFSGLIPLGKSSTSSNAPVGTVVVWGTLSANSLSKFIQDTNTSNPGLIIKYVQKSKDKYNSDLINAFANGAGPDVFFVSADMVTKYKNFIYTIPFTSYPEKVYRDTYIDGADIFLTKDGTLGFPVVSDPLVLYYNKNILNNAGIAEPPKYWDELFNLNGQLTRRSNDGVISQSTIALGSFDNVNNAKDIISLLLLGSGDPIISRNKTTDILSVSINDKTPFSISPLEQVMTFFNSFSNPTNQAYSWNRSLPTSRDMFTSGKLAFYIGHASELFDIQNVNPNLSFDVTDILQTRATNIKRTAGPIYIMSVNKKSPNLAGAMGVASVFATPENTKQISLGLSLPPTQKELLNTNPTDPYMFTFYKSAIAMHSWIDPDPTATDNIFRELVQNLISNRLTVADSINKVQNQLDLLIK